MREMLFLAFEDVVENDVDLKEMGLKKELAEPLMEMVKDKIKPKEVSIGGYLEARSYAGNGVEVVKKALQEGEKAAEGSEITYAGSGKYRVIVKAPDYKKAEKEMEACIQKVRDAMENAVGSKVDFKRF